MPRDIAGRCWRNADRRASACRRGHAEKERREPACRARGDCACSGGYWFGCSSRSTADIRLLKPTPTGTSPDGEQYHQGRAECPPRGDARPRVRRRGERAWPPDFRSRVGREHALDTRTPRVRRRCKLRRPVLRPGIAPGQGCIGRAGAGRRAAPRAPARAAFPPWRGSHAPRAAPIPKREPSHSACEDLSALLACGRGFSLQAVWCRDLAAGCRCPAHDREVPRMPDVVRRLLSPRGHRSSAFDSASAAPARRPGRHPRGGHTRPRATPAARWIPRGTRRLRRTPSHHASVQSHRAA